MDKDKFLQALDILELEYEKDVYEQFEIYTNYLLEYNASVNLTAITEKNDIYIKHYLDCISVLKYIDIPKNSKVIDVGVGAGFPSIPIKILRPDLDICMVDSLNKRVVFLENLVSKLGLKNISAIHGRAEDMAHNSIYRQQFDVALSRAVANLSTLSEYCTPFLKKEGYLYCLKGNNVDEEIVNAVNAIKKLNCKIENKMDIQIPFSDLQHSIVVIKKISDTPKTYPRKSGTPSKNPL